MTSEARRAQPVADKVAVKRCVGSNVGWLEWQRSKKLVRDLLVVRELGEERREDAHGDEGAR